MAEQAGLEIVRYRYFDKKTVGLDFEGMKEDIKNAKEGSIVLLHVCAQNPTGIDPTQEQWRELEVIVREKKHLALFDMVSRCCICCSIWRSEGVPAFRLRWRGRSDAQSVLVFFDITIR